MKVAAVLVLATILAAVSSASLVRRGETWKWSTSLPGYPNVVTPASCQVGDVYVVTSITQLFGVNITSGQVLWEFTPALQIDPIVPVQCVVNGALRVAVFSSFNKTNSYLSVINAVTGDAMWLAQTPIVNISRVSVGANVVLAESWSSTENTTVFDLSTGKLAYTFPETVFNARPAVAGDGVIVEVLLDPFAPSTPAHPTPMRVNARDAQFGFPRWSTACLTWVADTSRSANAFGAAAGAWPPLGGLIAVENMTVVSTFNFTSTIVFISRALGLPVGTITMPLDHTIVTGTFTHEGAIVVTDQATYLSSYDVTTKALKWSAALSKNPGFHPVIDLVTSITDAGPHVLLTIQVQPMFIRNFSAPNPTNVSAYDAKTGVLCGTVVFASDQQLVLPLLDGRLFVQTYTPGSAGYLLYSLATGLLLRNETLVQPLIGSVQIVRPGVIVATFANDTVAELAL